MRLACRTVGGRRCVKVDEEQVAPARTHRGRAERHREARCGGGHGMCGVCGGGTLVDCSSKGCRTTTAAGDVPGTVAAQGVSLRSGLADSGRLQQRDEEKRKTFRHARRGAGLVGTDRRRCRRSKARNSLFFQHRDPSFGSLQRILRRLQVCLGISDLRLYPYLCCTLAQPLSAMDFSMCRKR